MLSPDVNSNSIFKQLELGRTRYWFFRTIWETVLWHWGLVTSPSVVTVSSGLHSLEPHGKQFYDIGAWSQRRHMTPVIKLKQMLVLLPCCLVSYHFFEQTERKRKEKKWADRYEKIKKVYAYLKVRKAAKFRNRCNQLPHLTGDTIWKSDKNNTIKHHKQEPRGQPFPNGRPQGSNDQTRKHKKPKL